MPTGKVRGFKRYDKVKYFGEICFVKGRRTQGDFILMDIYNNKLDFRNIGGCKHPYYKNIERLSARRSVLCVDRGRGQY